MHEMSLVLSLLDIVEEYAQRYGFKRATTIRLSLGALAGIDEKALRFAFDVASEGTRAQGARLEMDIRPIVLECLECGREFTAREFPLACEACGSSQTVIMSGTEELKVVDMDVDDEADKTCA
ncbi:MAG TPA: hydrogenase maturation nickel metallochaperone HypA [Deltaproteobacteria bacterium]|nr:hydrogenase maturation nickel metallochaperone HypA [Deltaproteobacteria bacterium]